MTRTEFIKFYCDNSGIPEAYRTATGVKDADDADGEWIALPCHCDEEVCQGWAMYPVSYNRLRGLDWQISILPDDERAIYAAEVASMFKDPPLQPDRNKL